MRHAQEISVSGAPGNNVMADPRQTITPMQLELLALYASGYDYAKIAELKFLSPFTVRNNLHRARDRVGAKTVTQLCVICMEHGLIRKNGIGYKPVHVEGVIGE